MTEIFYKKALILAGGRGRRMGGCNKGNLIYNESTFLQKIVSSLSDYSDISVSLNRDQTLDLDGISVVYDTYDDIGPLSGIYEGLKLAKEEKYLDIFLAPCDCPNLTKDLISYINEFNAQEYDAIIVKDKDGGIHPLLGIYKTSLLPLVKEAIANKDYKVRNLFKKINIKYVSLVHTNFDDVKVLKNINTHKDYQELIEEETRVILAVSGIKNSGKTTIIENLVSRFKEKGIKVGTLKHDGHDFQMDNLGSDTDRHFKAGACKSMIFSNSKLMFIEDQKNVDLNYILSFFKDCQLVFLEGFKKTNLPKIEVVRKDISTLPAANRENLLFYVTDVESVIKDPSVKSVDIDDVEDIFNHIYSYFKERRCLIL